MKISQNFVAFSEYMNFMYKFPLLSHFFSADFSLHYIIFHKCLVKMQVHKPRMLLQNWFHSIVSDCDFEHIWLGDVPMFKSTFVLGDFNDSRE